MISDNRDEPYTLAVLAGGAGRRMGQAKANLIVRNKPILEFLLNQWQWNGPTMLVTAPGREHPPGWERFGREVSDPAPGEGPLRGILTAIQACETSIIVVTTVDMPGIESTHLRWIANHLVTQPESQGVLLSRTYQEKRRIEPFPSAFRASAVAGIKAEFAGGERSVHRLGAHPTVDVIAAPGDWPDEVWTNLNMPEDLERFS